MEVWKEYRKGEIPRGKYKAKIICGDSHLLTVELKSDKTRIILGFGRCEAIRIFERKFVNLDLYENIEDLKKDNFSNVIYEVEGGKYLKEVILYSAGFLDQPYVKQYTIITDNLLIDAVYLGEPSSLLKRIYKLDQRYLERLAKLWKTGRYMVKE